MLNEVESVTAKVCAYARARHSYFDRIKIYDDYLAYDLLGKDEYENMKLLLEDENNPVDELISPIILPRIHYAESRLESFMLDKKKAQYVICGAGMDSYAFRNNYDSLEVYELDHPNTQRYKKSRIDELEWIVPCNAHFIPIDFERQSMKETLSEAGFDETKKTFFALLGVSYYLTLATFSKTIEDMAGMASEGSNLVFDYPSREKMHPVNTGRMSRLRQATEQMGEVMKDGFTYEEIKKLLTEQGFEIMEQMTPEQIQRRYLSSQKNGMRAYENVNFILAKKNKENGREG